MGSGCLVCAQLQRENEELREQNKMLANALRGEVSSPHNTQLILGAALSGGDAMGLAKRLAVPKKGKVKE
jgi:hypothetical protein